MRQARPPRPGRAGRSIRQHTEQPAVAPDLPSGAKRLAATSTLAIGPLPAGVRQVIGRRLDRLPSATHRALRAAAILEREYSVAMLADVAGAPVSSITDLLDHAVEQDLVVASDGPVLRFAHALIQVVCYGELCSTDRQRLHRRAVAAVGRRAGANLPVDAYAHYLRRAGDVEPALEATLRAARRCL